MIGPSRFLKGRGGPFCMRGGAGLRAWAAARKGTTVPARDIDAARSVPGPGRSFASGPSLNLSDHPGESALFAYFFMKLYLYAIVVAGCR